MPHCFHKLPSHSFSNMSFNSSRSAKSCENSKRSRNSNTSNNSNSSSNSKKKKTTNQKTLGVAWGSDSPSSSRSSFRSSPFSDFGSYMVEKNRKLDNQFDAQAHSPSHGDEKPIFHGVSIFVDGFTVPSSQELRWYMLKYGGRFENYFSRHRVTHIICSNLPHCKIKNLRSYSGGLPVVKPTWIVDSVAANKLLSWVPYQLDQLANNQPKLSAFFSLKSSPVSEDSLAHGICQVIPEYEDSSLKVGRSKDANHPYRDEFVEHRKQSSREPDDLVRENTIVTMIKEPTSRSGNSCDMNVEEQSDDNTEDSSIVRTELHSSPIKHSASVSSYGFLDNQNVKGSDLDDQNVKGSGLDNRNMKGSPSSTISGPSNKRHSTLEDPNFVENYFKNSRLHFIGTWRNRYRKRFSSLSNGFKCTSNHLNTSADSQKNAIIHVDMDCFFVSVVIRNNPELQDKPIAVCHSDNPEGTAEISSANYPARNYGVRAGMFVRDAKDCCPHLVIFPYNFEAYEEAADQFYNILHKHCKKVQAVSCDEAFLDVIASEVEDPQLLASTIRKEIFETTGCTASAGISGNMLMARLATRTAKPDGQCFIPPEKVDDYLHQLPIKALPGIGHVLEEKLKKRNVWTCGQLRMVSKDSLQKDFGIKTGEMLWNYSRGVDNRLVGVIQESKSIGADVNWGVRFKDLKDSQHFLTNLCKEVSIRLQGCGVQGRTFTLKIKKRRKDAGEPTKYMGCGDCENLSHSITVPVPTDDVEVLQRITKQLFGSFHMDVKEIRGMGLQVSKLESADNAKQGLERKFFKSWLASASASASVNTVQQCDIYSMAKERINRDCEIQSTDGTSGQLCADSFRLPIQVDNNPSIGEACLNQGSTLPPLSHLDMGVVESLPPELFTEINEMYGGKLIDSIAKNKGKGKQEVNIENNSSSLCAPSHEQVEGAMTEGKGPLFSDLVFLNEIPAENKCSIEEAQTVLVSGARSNNVPASTSGLGKTDIMPSSLSQLDTSVLQQLPEDLRVDILEQLPAHRREDFSRNAALGPLAENPQESVIKSVENHSRSIDFVLNKSLWIGNPPKWVDKFKDSNCLILKFLAEMYHKSGSTGNLSSILQHAISESQHPHDASTDDFDEAIYTLSELLKQYIKLKLELDIEEIYVCFRLLRRFMMKSEIFLQVYNTVFPYLQVLLAVLKPPKSTQTWDKRSEQSFSGE